VRPGARLVLRAQYVVAAHDDIAGAAKVGADAGGAILGLIAAGEAAAMDEDHRGTIRAPGAVRKIKVELLLTTGAEERDVAQTKDRSGRHGHVRTAIGGLGQRRNLGGLDALARLRHFKDMEFGDVGGEGGRGGEQEEERTHKGRGRNFLPRPCRQSTRQPTTQDSAWA